MWTEAKLLPFSLGSLLKMSIWGCHMKTDFLVSQSRADVCGLGKAWQQIYDALPLPPHKTFLLFCHFFYFKTLTKVNCNLFCRDGPAASCSVHVQASCCSFACSSIQRCFIHLDSHSLYYLPRMNKLKRTHELKWAAKCSFEWQTLKASIPHVCGEFGEIMGERCLLLWLELFVFKTIFWITSAWATSLPDFGFSVLAKSSSCTKTNKQNYFSFLTFFLTWHPPPHILAIISF